jgi:hypothetical protein
MRILIIFLTFLPFLFGAGIGALLRAKLSTAFAILIFSVLIGITLNIDYATFTDYRCGALVLWWFFATPFAFGLLLIQLHIYFETIERDLAQVLLAFLLLIDFVLIFSGPITVYYLEQYGYAFVRIGLIYIFQ